MSENRHTPGTWDWIDKSEPIIFSTQDREEEKESVDIAMCFDITGDEQIANARLIAAAPDLLEACKRAYFLLETKNIKDEYFEVLKIGLGDLLPSQVVDQKLIEAAIEQAEKES